MKLLVLAGTEDGRVLASALQSRGHEVLVSTLTSYGADLVMDNGIPVRCGQLDAKALSKLLKEGSFEALIDATHPYATQVKEMAKAVCKEYALPYFLWQRSALELEENPLIHWAVDLPEAAAIAANLGKRILLTTGSNALSEWVAQSCMKDKTLFIRVLPTAEVLTKCEALGFKPNQIIAAQGPFSQGWDEAMFKQLDINVVIAKESGQIGGTPEKVQACLNLDIPLVMIKRPQTTSNGNSTVQEFIKQLEGIL